MAYSTTHGTAEELRRASEEMQHIEDKLIDIYVDRTDADRDTIVELMHDGKFIGVDKAMEIGLISTIVEPISAKRVDNNIFNQTQENMATDEIKVKRSLWEKVLSALGLGESEAETEQVMDANDANQVEETKPLNLTLETADGATLTVEREDGEPQVGDKASPDGEHQMPDGKTIIVTDGEITEIREPETEETEPEPDAKDEEINALKAKIEELQKQLEDANANGKSEDEKNVLAEVEKMGGLAQLKKMSSDYTPKKREDEKNTPLNTTESRKYDEVLTRILNRKRTY
jgi:ATP-dependent Clp protease protease subunit